MSYTHGRDEIFPTVNEVDDDFHAKLGNSQIKISDPVSVKSIFCFSSRFKDFRVSRRHELQKLQLRESGWVWVEAESSLKLTLMEWEH